MKHLLHCCWLLVVLCELPLGAEAPLVAGVGKDSRKSALRRRATPALVSVTQVVSRAAYESAGIVKKTGFVVDKKRGWIVTTSVPGGFGAAVSTYELTFAGGYKLEAKSLYRDPLYNIEVLVVDPRKIPDHVTPLSLEKQDTALQDTLVLGSKSDEQDIFQQGLVTSVHEARGVVTSYQSMRVSLNTPGALLPGGPALNEGGKVVGLVLQADQTFAACLWGGYLHEVLEALQVKKRPKRLVVEGAHIQTYSLVDAFKYWQFPRARVDAFLRAYPQAQGHGLVVLERDPASSLQLGDVVVAIDGRTMGYSLFDFHTTLLKSKKNHVTFRVVRQGKEVTVEVPLRDVWPHVIKKMVAFGGAIFYESDLIGRRFFNVPLGTLMVSKVSSGGVFSNVFPPLPIQSDTPFFVATILSLGNVKASSLDVLEKAIPRLAAQPRFPVIYQSHGTHFNGVTLETNRNQRFGAVDILFSTSLPEVLFWSESDYEWKTKTIDVSTVKCLVK